MKLPQIGTRALIIGGSVIALGAVTGVVALNSPSQTGATDIPPIQQQVDNQQKELDNHDARITNNENDIKSLQGATNTAPSSNNVAVPTVTPAPTPVPITVTAYEKIVLDANSTDCEYTYSDGTTFQWHWQTTDPHGSWVTDGVGQNGHWVPSVDTTGVCDQSAVGSTKTN